MKKLINMAFLIIVSIFAFSVSAQDESASVDQYEKLEEVMFNTSNQFVYAFFGKEMLLYYLNDDDDIAAVESASEQDLERLAAPFNALTGKFFMAGMTVIYFLTVAYFILRASLLAAESTWLMQRRGTTYMDQKEYRAFMIKVVLLGGIAVMPIKISNDLVEDTFYTNAATALFFDMLGFTHRIGDEAMGELILEQKQNLSTITLPAAESKWDAGKEINQFFACVRLDASRGNKESYRERVDLYREGTDAVEGYLQVGRCSLSITFGFDEKSTQKLNLLMKQAPDLNLPESLFVQGQKSAFEKVLNDVLNQASKKSEVLVMPAPAIEDNAFFRERSTLGDGTGASLRQLEAWHNDCDSVYAFTPEENNLSRIDRIVYDRLLSRCLSKDMTQTLVYPDRYAVVNSFMNNRQKTQKDFALCVDNSSLSQGSRFVSRYTLNASLTRQTEIEENAIDQCLANVCSSNSVENGGLYACASSVDLYQSRLRDLQIKDRGTLMMGFYMFNLFVYQPPSASAKAIYNNLNFSFEEVAEPPLSIMREPFATAFIDIPALSENTLLYDEVMSDLSIPKGNSAFPIVSLPVDAPNAFERLLPMTRLVTCTQNPLQVVGGYVCGNVPSEFSKFGFDLLDVAVNLKTLLILGNTFKEGANATSSLVNKVGGAIKGTKFEDPAKNMSDKVKTLATSNAVALVGNSGIMSGMVAIVDNIGFSTRDEFGLLSTTEIDRMLNTAAFTAIIAISQSDANSMLFRSVDGLLTFLIFIGFFMGFIFPLIPMLFVISAITMFIYLVLKTVLLHGFKIVDAVFDRDSDILSEKLDVVFADWLATLLKLPMTVIGVVLSWLMANVIIAHVLSTLDTNVITNDGTTGYFDFIISVLFSFIVIIVIYNMVLTVIESFYDFTVDWVLGQMTNSPFSEEKAINFKDTQDLYSLVGR